MQGSCTPSGAVGALPRRALGGLPLVCAPGALAGVRVPGRGRDVASGASRGTMEPLFGQVALENMQLDLGLPNLAPRLKRRRGRW